MSTLGRRGLTKTITKVFQCQPLGRVWSLESKYASLLVPVRIFWAVTNSAVVQVLDVRRRIVHSATTEWGGKSMKLRAMSMYVLEKIEENAQG